MSHFWGTDTMLLAEKVRLRMAYLANKDVEIQNQRAARLELAKRRGLAAKRIQKFYRSYRARGGFRNFMVQLRSHAIPTPQVVARSTATTAQGTRLNSTVGTGRAFSNLNSPIKSSRPSEFSPPASKQQSGMRRIGSNSSLMSKSQANTGSPVGSVASSSRGRRTPGKGTPTGSTRVSNSAKGSGKRN